MTDTHTVKLRSSRSDTFCSHYWGGGEVLTEGLAVSIAEVVLDMAMPMSTIHIYSGLPSFPTIYNGENEVNI